MTPSKYGNYLTVDVKGNCLFHKYVVKDSNEHRLEILNGFQIDLFLKQESPSKYKSIYGDNLAIHEFDKIRDAKSFMYSHKDGVYGQTNLAYQFIGNNYENEINFKIENSNILIIDIETAFDDSGFSTPDEARQEILTISCKVINKTKTTCFGIKNCDIEGFVKCENEKDLLIKFQKYVIDHNIDIITGWNVDGYDIPYIINRCLKLFDVDFVNKFSPFYKYQEYTNNMNEFYMERTMRDVYKTYKTYSIIGIEVVDYLVLYKLYSSNKLESYSLGFVADYEIQSGKTDYSEYGNLMDLYEKNYKLYVEYNKQDVDLIEQLDNKLNFMYLAHIRTYLGKVKLSDVSSPIRFLDTLIYNREKNRLQIPPNKSKNKDYIVGGYVKQPTPKLYNWIVVLDLSSWYPSIMSTFNMSPETLVRPAIHNLSHNDDYINLSIENDYLKQKNICMSSNGSCYRKDIAGIFTKIINDLSQTRSKFKKIALEISKKLETLDDKSPEYIKLKNEELIYNARQTIIKRELNSLYGACNNNFFRYYDLNIAEGITLTGRSIIRYISKHLNDFLHEYHMSITNNPSLERQDYIIFNDTDSAGLDLEFFVNYILPDKNEQKIKTKQIVKMLDVFVKKEIDPFLAKKFKEFAEYYNAYDTNKLSMKREVIANKGVWRGKKNYILNVYDKEGIVYQKPKIKMTGVETAKSSVPRIVRNALKDCYEIIFNGTENDLIEYVKSFKSKFLNMSISDISFPRSINDIDKWYDDDFIYKKKTPIHVKGSILHNRLISEYGLIIRPIKNGDKIKYVYLKNMNPTGMNVISFIDELPTNFKLDDYVDRITQYEKSFLRPLMSFTNIVGWKTEKTNTFYDLF